MSHKSTISLKITDESALGETLTKMGLQFEKAETTNGLRTKSNYGSQAESEVHILLKKDAKGHTMQGVGFKKESDGTFTAVGDFFEIRGSVTKEGEQLGSNFKDVLNKRYALTKAMNELEKSYFTCEEAKVDNDSFEFVAVSNF